VFERGGHMPYHVVDQSTTGRCSTSSRRRLYPAASRLPARSRARRYTPRALERSAAVVSLYASVDYAGDRNARADRVHRAHRLAGMGKPG
jgi:hypothetical protein